MNLLIVFVFVYLISSIFVFGYFLHIKKTDDEEWNNLQDRTPFNLDFVVFFGAITPILNTVLVVHVLFGMLMELFEKDDEDDDEGENKNCKL